MKCASAIRNTHVNDVRDLRFGRRIAPEQIGSVECSSSAPSELPQCDDLLFLLFAQDIAHAEGAYKGSGRSQCPGLSRWPGFG